MKFIKMSKEEIEKRIASGELKQIHLSSLERILMPRGSLQKESVGLKIFEVLLNNYLHWNDPKYSDRPDVSDLLLQLRKNLDDETFMAWNEFLRLINTCETETEIWEEFWKRRDEERNK